MSTGRWARLQRAESDFSSQFPSILPFLSLLSLYLPVLLVCSLFCSYSWDHVFMEPKSRLSHLNWSYFCFFLAAVTGTYVLTWLVLSLTLKILPNSRWNTGEWLHTSRGEVSIHLRHVFAMEDPELLNRPCYFVSTLGKRFVCFSVFY